ncbi:hypothetical protein SAMN05428967_2491 [Phyllobacterium sp. YR620]|nr:hypothetical protein SAMN05428967_2491 [Phyllobacterium sp. YR620]
MMVTGNVFMAAFMIDCAPIVKRIAAKRGCCIFACFLVVNPS